MSGTKIKMDLIRAVSWWSNRALSIVLSKSESLVLVILRCLAFNLQDVYKEACLVVHGGQPCGARDSPRE